MSDEQVRVQRAKDVKHSVDLRLAIIYGLVVAALVIMFGALQVQTSNTRRTNERFERGIVANCQQIDTANATFNGVLDQLSRNAQNTTGITPAQKAQAEKVYASLHLPISACPS